jgi:hypothetical protein
LGFGSLYTKKKAATFNLPWVTNADFKLDSFALLVQLELEFNVNSSNFMVVHCLPCNYRILFFLPYIYMLQNLPAEINSIYAYINPIVAVLLGALIFEHAIGTRIYWFCIW